MAKMASTSPGGGKDAGVHKDDIGHRKEGGGPGKRLGFQVRAAFGELKIFFHKR